MSKHQRMAEVFRDFWVCLTQPRTECPGPHPDSFQRRRLHSLSGQRVSLLCHLHSAQEKNKCQSCNFDKIGDYRMKFYMRLFPFHSQNGRSRKNHSIIQELLCFYGLELGKENATLRLSLPFCLTIIIFFPNKFCN